MYLPCLDRFGAAVPESVRSQAEVPTPQSVQRRASAANAKSRSLCESHCVPLEPVPCRDLRFAHGACAYHLAKRWRAKRCINGGEMHGIENVCGREAHLKGLHFLDLNVFGNGHIHLHRAGPNNGVASGCAKDASRSGEGSRIKPFLDCWIAQLY